MAVAFRLEREGNRQNGRWKRGSIPKSDINGSVDNRGWPQRVTEAGAVLDYSRDLARKVLRNDGVMLDAYKDCSAIGFLHNFRPDLGGGGSTGASSWRRSAAAQTQ